MIWQEMLRDERNQGREEGENTGIVKGKRDAILVLLQEKGTISEELCEIITTQTDTTTLNAWIKIASRVTSIEQFMNEI